MRKRRPGAATTRAAGLKPRPTAFGALTTFQRPNAVIARSTEGTTRQSVFLPSRSSHPNAISTGRGAGSHPRPKGYSQQPNSFSPPLSRLRRQRTRKGSPAKRACRASWGIGSPSPPAVGEGALREHRSGWTASKAAGLKPRPTVSGASYDVSATTLLATGYADDFNEISPSAKRACRASWGFGSPSPLRGGRSFA